MQVRAVSLCKNGNSLDRPDNVNDRVIIEGKAEQNTPLLDTQESRAHSKMSPSGRIAVGGAMALRRYVNNRLIATALS